MNVVGEGNSSNTLSALYWWWRWKKSLSSKGWLRLWKDANSGRMVLWFGLWKSGIVWTLVVKMNPALNWDEFWCLLFVFRIIILPFGSFWITLFPLAFSVLFIFFLFSLPNSFLIGALSLKLSGFIWSSLIDTLCLSLMSSLILANTS